MNILNATIVSIKHVESLMLVFLDVEGNIFNSLMLENSLKDELKVGMSVNLIFKETEVIIATKDSIVSERNGSLSKITHVQNGKLLSNITFDFFGHDINAIITKGALHGLKCKIGDEFRWFVKANEVTIARVDNG